MGTGQLPDLIRLKDIQTGRLGEASDPLRFNLFGSIAVGLIACRHGMKHADDASSAGVDGNSFCRLIFVRQSGSACVIVIKWR